MVGFQGLRNPRWSEIILYKYILPSAGDRTSLTWFRYQVRDVKLSPGFNTRWECGRGGWVQLFTNLLLLEVIKKLAMAFLTLLVYGQECHLHNLLFKILPGSFRSVVRRIPSRRVLKKRSVFFHLWSANVTSQMRFSTFVLDFLF